MPADNVAVARTLRPPTVQLDHYLWLIEHTHPLDYQNLVEDTNDHEAIFEGMVDMLNKEDFKAFLEMIE